MLIIVHDSFQGVNAHDTRFGSLRACRFTWRANGSTSVRQRKHKPRELGADLLGWTWRGLILNGGAAPYALT